jgi:hypothetical protein
MSIWWTNRFWSVSLEHTLFLDFLKLFVNMRLVVSFAGKNKNAFFGPTDQKLWMFEVSRRSLGRVGMCCSQWERVDHTPRILGARRLGGGAGGHIIEGPVQGQSPTRRPMVAGIATAAHSGRRLANARRLRDAACTTGCGVFFKVFLYSFFYSFLRPFHVAWAWASWGGGGWVYSSPFFEACPYTWKC